MLGREKRGQHIPWQYNDNKRCKNKPREAVYQVGALGTGHLVQLIYYWLKQ